MNTRCVKCGCRVVRGGPPRWTTLFLGLAAAAMSGVTLGQAVGTVIVRYQGESLGGDVTRLLNLMKGRGWTNGG